MEKLEADNMLSDARALSDVQSCTGSVGGCPRNLRLGVLACGRRAPVGLEVLAPCQRVQVSNRSSKAVMLLRRNHLQVAVLRRMLVCVIGSHLHYADGLIPDTRIQWRWLPGLFAATVRSRTLLSAAGAVSAGSYLGQQT